MADLIVIVQVLVAQATPEHPLADQCAHIVRHPARVTAIGETPCEPIH
jgi:hypothetical protein